jgi:streptogramin lyase
MIEGYGRKLVQINAHGGMTEIALPRDFGQPYGLAAAADGTIWFTGQRSGKIGRFTPRNMLAVHQK